MVLLAEAQIESDKVGKVGRGRGVKERSGARRRRVWSRCSLLMNQRLLKPKM